VRLGNWELAIVSRQSGSLPEGTPCCGGELAVLSLRFRRWIRPAQARWAPDYGNFVAAAARNESTRRAIMLAKMA